MTRPTLVLGSLLLLALASSASGYDQLVTKQAVKVPGFATTTGDVLPVLELGVETYGALNAARDNVVLVCHPIGLDGHAAGRYAPTDAPGWWDGLIGSGSAIDTDRLCVISIDLPCGLRVRDPRVITTGPSTIDPRTGKRWGLTFPRLGVRDLVWAQRAVLDKLGVTRLRAVIGPSMGGMVAMQWAIEYPGAADLVVAVSSPMTFSALERMGFQASALAIRSDASWMWGDYQSHGVQPVVGVAMAQQGLATLAQGRVLLFALGWPAYLAEASRSDANHYLWLIDLHSGWDLGAEHGSRQAALRRARSRVVLIGATDDEFITPARVRADGRELAAASLSHSVEIFRGTHGHYSCIEDTAAFAGALATEVRRVTP